MAILRSIINSDYNVKLDINRVETTNGTYAIYYKGIDDFIIIKRKVDKNVGRIDNARIQKI